jgi:hypothetical protein
MVTRKIAFSMGFIVLPSPSGRGLGEGFSYTGKIEKVLTPSPIGRGLG